MPGRQGTTRDGRVSRWGYHRLDPRWAERLVEHAGIRPGDLVLDIGAGDGALVAPLLRRGARVVAIELHAERASRLRERFADDAVKVVRADAADLRLPRRPQSGHGRPEPRHRRVPAQSGLRARWFGLSPYRLGAR